jgi:hypothetical protein
MLERARRVLAVPQRLAGWRGYLAAIALVLAGAAVAQTAAGHQILRDTGLSEAPASFTSLSFTDPNQLPLQLTSKRASLPVSFVITNSSHLVQAYQWRLLVIRGATSARLDGGTVLVRAGASASLQRVARVTCASGRIGVKVQLQKPAESIEAWLACSPEENR